MKIKLLVEGGSMKPGPALSQKIGPLGININQVIQKVNEATTNFKGLKVPVELDINPATKEFEVQVFSPPVSELLKKELGIQKGSGTQKKLQVGNISIEQIISVAKTKMPDLLCKDLKSAAKTVIGSCVCLGVLVENKSAVEVEKEIDKGKYDKEIQEEKTEVSPEKKKKLDNYFAEVSKEEQRKIKLEEAAAAEEKEEKEKSTEKPAEEVKPEEEEKK